MTDRATFSAPAVRKALKLAKETGLPLAGWRVTPDGAIEVQFATKAESDADAALSAWQRKTGNG
jgi:hypothetical protein